METTHAYHSLAILQDHSNGCVQLYLAERHGDHRSYYIRNNLDGRFVCGDPQVLSEIAEAINDRLPAMRDRDHVLGFAEGSIVLASVIAAVRGSLFVCSTKTQRSNLPQVVRFMEGHRTDSPEHFIYSLKKGDDVILVEDEISTGETILNAWSAIRQFGANVSGIASVVEVNNFQCREKIQEATGLDLVALTTITLV